MKDRPSIILNPNFKIISSKEFSIVPFSLPENSELVQEGRLRKG